jgi:hypothetical protein
MNTKHRLSKFTGILVALGLLLSLAVSTVYARGVLKDKPGRSPDGSQLPGGIALEANRKRSTHSQIIADKQPCS